MSTDTQHQILNGTDFKTNNQANLTVITLYSGHSYHVLNNTAHLTNTVIAGYNNNIVFMIYSYTLAIRFVA